MIVIVPLKRKISGTVLKYCAIVRINVRARIETIAELVGQIPLVVVRLVLLHALYATTYYVSDPNSFGDLTVKTIVWRLMLITPFESALYPTISTIINEEIATGTIAYSLTKPYSYLGFHYAAFLGRALPVVAINFLTGMITASLLVGMCSTSVGAFFCGTFLLWIGCTLDFLIETIVGLLAFWVEDTTSLSFIYRQTILILGGFIIPISLYPPLLQKIAHILPFSSLFYEPASLIVAFDAHVARTLFFTQLGWLIALSTITITLFKKGMKHVSIAGG